MRTFLTAFAFMFCLFFSQNIMSKEIVLTKDNTLVLNSAFTGKSVSELIGKAKQMDADLKNGYPIYLFLDTPGGEINAGLELIEFLAGLNRPVHTVTLFAASMGWQLLQHLGDRYVLKYGVLMSHKAFGGFRGEFGGDSSQIDSRYGLWLRRVRLMDKVTVDRTKGKKTLKQYQSEYDNELWLNGGEAVQHGYADEVVTIKCSKGLDGTVDKQVRFMGFRLNLTFDECPIRTYPMSITAQLRTNEGYMELDEFLEKGGKFGKNCRDRVSAPKKDYYGNVVAGPQEPELCLINKSLSLEDIEESIKDEVNKIKNKNSQIIKMSFGRFVSEF